MKKTIFYNLFFLFLILLMTSPSFAEDDNADPGNSLDALFPSLKVRDQFIQTSPAKYYRFPADTWYFDPLALSYFPHEVLETDDWALLGRIKDGKTSKQIIYLDKPTNEKIIHGIDLGKAVGFLRDFYLYIDVFISDNYPENTGSCYVYYSDSLLVGYATSSGILIDPENGIYRATNKYGSADSGYFSGYYLQGSEEHKLDLKYSLDPKSYSPDIEDVSNKLNLQDTPFNVVTLEENNLNDLNMGSIGNAFYPTVKLDDQFFSDLQYLMEKPKISSQSSLKPYRIEIIRVDGEVEIYINGKQVAAFDDEIIITKDGHNVPDKVSWSYGPILYEGGQTISCYIGNIVVFGTGKRED